MPATVLPPKALNLKRLRLSAALSSAALLSGCVQLSSPTAVQPPAPSAHGTTVISGLNSPQGVLVAPDGSVWAADSGTGGVNTFKVPGENGEPGTSYSYGDTARVVKATAGGTQSVAAFLPSLAGGEEATGGGKLALLGSTVYVANGTWDEGTASAAPRPAKLAAVVRLDTGGATEIANTWDFEKANNPDQKFPAYQPEVDSHAYGLTAAADGTLYVTDAGGNDLLRLDPATGKLSLVAVFAPVEEPAGQGGANVPFQPVPTAVAVAPDGGVFVSLLPGGPSLPGTAKVVKVAPDGSVSDYATGLSALTDLRFGPDGQLYAVSLGQLGAQGPAANSGAVLRLASAGGKEVVLGGLNTPTSIAFNAAGDAFIAVGGAAKPGSGKVVRYDKLTSYQGQ